MKKNSCVIRKNCLTVIEGLIKLRISILGAIAQLGERLHGMQEVGGSIPPSSTINSRVDE
ncbi:hypothetical protein Lrub_2168 [Legionella rubrilucens]|uniref:Uncharacterized protein n=1 Tax=Legionella rubrilucens TaxID=458 RepID=A0A0W0XRW5_9GAMM|nr:hypothetical protein Lrub_2168 [Legionella rubrilucens]